MLAEQHPPSSIELRSIDRAPLLAVPNPEVVERPKRRKYSAEYKRKILKELDGVTQLGQAGTILRREGLYMSHILTWRWQRERGELAALGPKKRGRKPTEAEILDKRNKELARENKRLHKRLKRAELIIDIQKKISEITGIHLKEVENEEED